MQFVWFSVHVQVVTVNNFYLINYTVVSSKHYILTVFKFREMRMLSSAIGGKNI